MSLEKVFPQILEFFRQNHRHVYKSLTFISACIISSKSWRPSSWLFQPSLRVETLRYDGHSAGSALRYHQDMDAESGLDIFRFRWWLTGGERVDDLFSTKFLGSDGKVEQLVVMMYVMYVFEVLICKEDTHFCVAIIVNCTRQCPVPYISWIRVSDSVSFPMYSKILHPSMCLLLFSPVCIRWVVCSISPRGFGFSCYSLHFAYTNIPKLHERCHNMPQTLVLVLGRVNVAHTKNTKDRGGRTWARLETTHATGGSINGFTRWAPTIVMNGVITPYKWPYKWATGVITLQKNEFQPQL